MSELAGVGRRRILRGATACGLLVVAAILLTVASGPERALYSHLVEATVAAIGWITLSVRDAGVGGR